MPNIRKTFNFRDGVQVDDEVLVVKGDRVGLGTTSPDKTLDVRGNAQVIGIVTANNLDISGVGTFGGIKVGTGITLDATSGVISATSFKGNGATLSNLPTSQWTNVNVVGAGASPIYVDGNVGIFTDNPANRFQVGGDPNNGVGVGINSEGDIFASGIITATDFKGSLTGNVTGNLTGTASNATLAASATVATNAQGLTGTPDIIVKNIQSTGISTLPTLETTDLTVPTLKGYSTLRSLHGALTTLVVTVAAKTSAHRYNGQGSNNGFLIDGVSAPFLTFTPGRTYRFDVSDGSNAQHPLRFYYDADRTTAYPLSSYTISGTHGTGNAYIEIVVSDTTPTVLHYGCSNHPLMGNGIQTNSNVLDTEHNSTVRGSMTATSFVGNITGNVTGNVTGDVTGNVNATSGVSTFTTLDINGDVDIDGHAELDALNVAGVVTATRFVGDIQGPVVGNVTSPVSSIGIATGTSLGIGTGTANSNIQIVSSSASSLTIGKGGAVGVNNLQLRYGGGASRFSGSNALDLINSGDGHFNYFLSGTNSFVWHKGNSNELMALTSTGNLGIGITNPSHKLSVDGTSRVSGVATFQNAVFIDGILTVNDATISNLTGNVTGSIKSAVGMSTLTHLEATDSIGIGITGSGNLFNVGGSVANRFLINADGRVGIKTSILKNNVELDVRGDVQAQYSFVVGEANGKSSLDFSDLVNVDPEGTGQRPKVAYMLPPKVDNAQRIAFTRVGGGDTHDGALIYNTDANKLQVYVHPNWVNLH